jgi:signal transduction histidine kinase
MLRNIRTRLFLTYLLLIIFTITLMGSLFYFLTHEHLMKSKVAYLGTSSEVFIKFITPFIETDEDLGPATKFFIRQCWEQMDYQLQVVDKNGDIVGDSRGGALSFPGKGEKRLKIALEGKESVWTEKTQDGLMMHRCFPVKINGRTVGAAKLSLSLEEFNDLLYVMRRYFFLTFLMSLFAAILASLFFISTLMKPVTRIRDMASRIARGDLTSRVNYASNDELGDLSKTINAMAEELKKLEQARSEFLGNVSHELKTPLTIIKGFALTLLSEPGIPKEWTRSLELINRESDRLTALVEEILELTRLRSGRLALRLVPCDVEELLASVHCQMLPRAEKLGVALELDMERDLPTITADPDRLKEILINLIDNSLKYSQQGGSALIRARNGAGMIGLEVRDRGPGIPQEDIPFLFERFFRGSARSSKIEGSGLGLAIVKELVEAHGGTIAVKSTMGEGTVFEVSLPLNKDNPSSQPGPPVNKKM